MNTSSGLVLLVLLLTGSAGAQILHEPESEISVRKAVAPPYDDRLYFPHLQGEVRIRATVLPSGQIEDAVIRESFWTWNTSMNEFFLTYARKWVLEPSDAPRMIDIVFHFVLLPEETSEDDLGTVFVAPSTIEIRARKHPPASFHRLDGANH